MTEDLHFLLPELEDQERRLVFRRFDNHTAWRPGVELLDAARDRRLPLGMSVRRNGQRAFHTALAGISVDNDSWIERKSAVAFLRQALDLTFFPELLVVRTEIGAS